VAAAFAPRPEAKRGATTAAAAGAAGAGASTPEGAAVVDVAYSATLDAAAVVLASGHCALLRQAAGATPPRTPTGGVGNGHGGGGAWVLGLECVRWLGSGDDATTAAFAPTARLLAVRASLPKPPNISLTFPSVNPPKPILCFVTLTSRASRDIFPPAARVGFQPNNASDIESGWSQLPCGWSGVAMMVSK